MDQLVRQRIRALRLARGWTLDVLAERACLSRIETGTRRIALGQLIPIAKALDTAIDHLVESPMTRTS